MQFMSILENSNLSSCSSCINWQTTDAYERKNNPLGSLLNIYGWVEQG